MQPNAHVEPASGLSVWKRLLAGGAQRKSRLHDEFGARIPLGRALRNGPRALLGKLILLATKRTPARPWISYDGQAAIARHLRPDSQVLEFGAGESSLWYARRAGHLICVENEAGWYEQVCRRLQEVDNAECVFAADADSWIAAAPERDYDFIVIDGDWRDRCAEFAIEHLAPGGAIYLDNADKAANLETTGDVPKARRLLLDFARRNDLPVREFTDFAPSQLFAERGMMVGGRP